MHCLFSTVHRKIKSRGHVMKKDGILLCSFSLTFWLTMESYFLLFSLSLSLLIHIKANQSLWVCVYVCLYCLKLMPQNYLFSILIDNFNWIISFLMCMLFMCKHIRTHARHTNYDANVRFVLNFGFFLSSNKISYFPINLVFEWTHLSFFLFKIRFSRQKQKVNYINRKWFEIV